MADLSAVVSIQRYESAITTPAILRIECAGCGTERKRWGKSITTTGWWKAETETDEIVRFCSPCGKKIAKELNGVG